MINSGLIISTILATFAIVSVPVSAIWQNHQNYKLKKMEFNFDIFKNSSIHKRELIESFVKYSNSLLSKYPDPHKDFVELFVSVQLYVDEPLRKKLSDFSSLLTANNFEQASSLFKEILPALNDYMNSLKFMENK